MTTPVTTSPSLASSPGRTGRSSSSRVLGRYALFDPIASGGMASVHLGRLIGASGFSRTVAIKRLHESVASDPEYVAMLLDEARLVGRIRHPNVVPTLDVVSKEGELWLVMEYVAGESLSALLKRARSEGRQVPIPVAVDVIASVLRGLHAAHGATSETGEPLGIVHRDVSPQNMIVGSDGVARVLDFGIAKAEGRMQHTRTGTIKGKVRYMAPEQLAGKASPASDVYAASIVLWEALTGRRLFTGENDVEVMYQVVESRVDPPGAYRADLSPDLEAAVMRGLRKAPGERWPSAAAMADALEAATPMVTRDAVARWVLEGAGPELARRQRRVAEIECEVTPVAGPSFASIAPAAPVLPVQASTLSALSPVSGVVSTVAPRRGRVPALVATGVAMILVAMVAGRRSPPKGEPQVVSAAMPVALAPMPALESTPAPAVLPELAPQPEVTPAANAAPVPTEPPRTFAPAHAVPRSTPKLPPSDRIYKRD